ncbi:hypothetical protein BJ878DRAFT_549329, partial [Calycina marina]
YQAEIVNLREDLVKYSEQDDESGNIDRQLCRREWLELSSSKDSEQWEVWLEIRAKLKQYYKAVDRYRQIKRVPCSQKEDLQFVQKWLDSPDMGGCRLIDADRSVYDSQNASGLGALKSKKECFLTRRILYVLPKIYHYGIVMPWHHLYGRWIKKPTSSFTAAEQHAGRKSS